MKKNAVLIIGMLLPLIALADDIRFADSRVKAVCVEKWDDNNDNELSVEEAAAVKDIGTAFAFNGGIASFHELQYFTGISNIPIFAFYNCTNLQEISFPASVTEIKGSAFMGCTSLLSITIPETLTTLDGFAFDGCTSLREVVIQEGVKSIGEKVFANCLALNEIVIPASVNSIYGDAFFGCANITKMSVADANEKYDSRGDCNAIIETATNTLVSGCCTTVIPEDIQYIGDGAFQGINTLTAITIPSGVLKIGKMAFADCSGLLSIGLPSSMTEVDNGAFWGCSSLKGIVIPEGTTRIGNSCFKTCLSLTNVTLPSTLTAIGTDAFFECNNLTSVTAGFTTPMSISQETFSNRSKATLYVSKNAWLNFRISNYWKDFKNTASMENVMVGVALDASAVNVFSGGNVNLVVSLDNDDLVGYADFSMDIILPEGIDIASKDDGYDYTLADRCGEMVVSIEKRNDNTYHVTGICAQGNTISGTEGTMITFKLMANSEDLLGDYTGELRDGILTRRDGAAVKADNVSFPIHVEEPLLGDVNLDGIVTVTDAMIIVSRILNDQVEYPDYRMDINRDGIISVTDVMLVVDIILQ